MAKKNKAILGLLLLGGIGGILLLSKSSKANNEVIPPPQNIDDIIPINNINNINCVTMFTADLNDIGLNSIEFFMKAGTNVDNTDVTMTMFNIDVVNVAPINPAGGCRSGVGFIAENDPGAIYGDPNLTEFNPGLRLAGFFGVPQWESNMEYITQMNVPQLTMMALDNYTEAGNNNYNFTLHDFNGFGGDFQITVWDMAGQVLENRVIMIFSARN